MRYAYVRHLMVLGCLTVIACRTHYPPDPDSEMVSARPLYSGYMVNQSVNPKKGDKIDWYKFSYFKEADVTVRFWFGDVGKVHGVTGEISLVTPDGNVVQKQVILPHKRTYEFKFPVRKDQVYFIRVEAKKGKAKYMVKAETKPLDPCAKCGPGTTCCKPANVCCPSGTVCRDGACVDPNVCVPVCGPEEMCVQGRCVYGCAKPCRRGYICDPDRGRCIRKHRRSPRVRKRPVRPAPKCPPCGPGERCNPATGRCEAAVQTDAIVGKVLLATSIGGGRTEILINKGRRHGVKPGAKGSVAGIPFKVKFVTPTRCRAVVRAKPEAVMGRRVTIFR